MDMNVDIHIVLPKEYVEGLDEAGRKLAVARNTLIKLIIGAWLRGDAGALAALRRQVGILAGWWSGGGELEAELEGDERGLRSL